MREIDATRYPGTTVVWLLEPGDNGTTAALRCSTLGIDGHVATAAAERL